MPCSSCGHWYDSDGPPHEDSSVPSLSNSSTGGAARQIERVSFGCSVDGRWVIHTWSRWSTATPATAPTIQWLGKGFGQAGSTSKVGGAAPEDHTAGATIADEINTAKAIRRRDIRSLSLIERIYTPHDDEAGYLRDRVDRGHDNRLRRPDAAADAEGADAGPGPADAARRCGAAPELRRLLRGHVELRMGHAGRPPGTVRPHQRQDRVSQSGREIV